MEFVLCFPLTFPLYLFLNTICLTCLSAYSDQTAVAGQPPPGLPQAVHVRHPEPTAHSLHPPVNMVAVYYARCKKKIRVEADC